MTTTRRQVIAGGAAIAGLALPGTLSAATLKTRYSATSANGKAMLVKYAKAVDQMRNRIPKGDPRHWDFQWYTHWVPGPQDWSQAVARKAQVIQQTYGGAPSPNRDLAQAMWDDCQAHGYNPASPSQFQETYFLPWHRWFVYYFEQIIRGVLQDDSFTLPYWDYLSGSIADLSIPSEFYKDNSSPLYQNNRNSWVNQGKRIDLQNPGTLNLDAFKYNYYISSDSSTGFCPTLDGNPHGLVHDYTGGPQNMGYVPTAAGDPIFWLHHSNIDRLWASWNRAGNPNPVWDARSFPFADAQGRRVNAAPNGATNTQNLGYDYDTYQRAPAARALLTEPTFSALAPLASLRPSPAAAAGVTLGTAEPTRVTLEAAPRAAGAANLMALVQPRQSVFLTLSGVDVMESFSGTYNVFLGLPEGAPPPDVSSPSYAGTFGSFMLVGHMANMERGPSLVFDVTDRAGAIAEQGGLSSSPSVTFVPMGEISAAPTVGSISIVPG